MHILFALKGVFLKDLYRILSWVTDFRNYDSLDMKNIVF